MLKSLSYSIAIAILQVLFFSEPLRGQGSVENSWKLVKQEGNTKVYTRSREDIKIKEVRITTNMKTSMNKFLKVLNDVPGYANWVFKCQNAKRILTVSEHEFYYYTSSNLPFPLSDRDMVIHSRQWTDPLTQTVYAESVADPHYLPEKEDYVRVPYLKSAWVIQPLKDGTLKINYSISTDPGGSLPSWLVNMAITQGPVKTMELLAELVEKD